MNNKLFGLLFGVFCAGAVWAQNTLDSGGHVKVVSEPNYEYLERITNFRGPYTDQDDPVLLKGLQKEADRTGVDPREFVCRPPHCSRDESRLIIKLATPGAIAKRKSQNFGVQSSDLLSKATLTPIFKPQAVAKAVSKYNQTNSAMPMNSMGKRVDLSRWNSLRLPKGVNIDQAIAELKLDPRVEVVESDFERQLKGSESKPADSMDTVSTMVTANDPRKGEQWALERTRTEEAWQWLEDNGYPAWGDSNIVVAVIDSGVDYTHEDLIGSMWRNGGEIPDNGIDDDNNGFIDDVYGADVVGSPYDHDGDPQDDNGHGTHVAGIIAAQGNNGIGIIGVAPNAQIMAIKAAQYSGVLTSTDISEAILYAYQQGADIINMSFGGSGRSVLEEEALAVAFSNAVLIAAAGNSGTYNDLNCGPAALPSYPGAYPYVLGVMAESQAAASNGDWLARFSNWDCVARNGLEYEVMAPGVDVLSTIPGHNYATWDGTSMAAPVAAGMAVLIRTQFADKSIYSSRFIMGQVASTGSAKQGITPCASCSPISYLSADALKALTEVPKPSLSFLKHYLFDSTDRAGNDGDGIVDAGETIDLAVIIKNHWGMADNVEVTLSAQAQGAVSPDPYVSFSIPTVNYGGVGSFNEDDNGLIYDSEQLITGVNMPFRLTVASDTPNEHIIPLAVTMTATNGLDPNDSSTYTTTSRFSLIVQRGRELPRVIDSDAAGTDGALIDTDGVEDGVVTIDDSTLWLIDNPVLIAEGTTLKVGPGAILQFWGTQPDDTYAVFENSYLQVEGLLSIEGTANANVTLKPSDLFPNRGVVIDNRGTVNVSHAKLYNLSRQHYEVPGYENLPFDVIDHALITRIGLDGGIATWKKPTNTYFNGTDGPTFGVKRLTNSRLYRLGTESPYAREENGVVRGYTPTYTTDPSDSCCDLSTWSELSTSLIDNTYISSFYLSEFPKMNSSVVLNGGQEWINQYGEQVRKGSQVRAYHGSVTTKSIVSDIMVHDGKTYALAWVFNPNGLNTLNYQLRFNVMDLSADRANEFAASLGGSLAVFSSDAEYEALADFVADWWSTIDQSPAEDLLELCADSLPLCTYVRDNKYATAYNIVYGLKKTSGVWSWVTGEESQLSNDPLENIDLQEWQQSEYATTRTPSLGQFNSTPASLALIEIPSVMTLDDLQAAWDEWTAAQVSKAFYNNAVLNQWWDPVPSHWLRIEGPNKYDLADVFGDKFNLSGTYWGTNSLELIQNSVQSFEIDFNKMATELLPLASSPSESAYPFVVDVDIKDAAGNRRSSGRFASEGTVWDVTFNRDMDATVQPLVTFGPDVPYTDFTVPGDWVDARTWRGTITISPVAPDGYQYVRVAGAVAADDPGLVTGNDQKRFRFEVITSGTESLNLQASGGEGYVDLSWNQDDYDTLMGFNIYRSTQSDSGFIRINQTLVGNEDRTFRDDSTEPGQQYFYYFTVALDGFESDPSNVAAATPIDTVKPVMAHNIVSSAGYGSSVLIQAEVTDNIAVQDVTLYYRTIGETAYTSVGMANIEGNTYRASIPATATLPPGVEYYIAASDGASYTYSGRASNPNTITVENNPIVSAVTPAVGTSAGGDTIAITGKNFAEGASVRLGNATCQNVVVESETRITCVTPASAPNVVALTVENPDGATGSLASAFTFVGNQTSLALPDVEAQNGQTLDVPLTIAAVSDLQSFSAVITWNPTHLSLANVMKGAMISGWELDWSTTTTENGLKSVSIAAGSGTRVSASGTLASLEFLVVAEGDVTSLITIESAQLNEGTIDASLENGSFSVAPGYSIGGTVKFWNSVQTPVEATLSLDGAQSTNSDAVTGQYAFIGLLDAQHNVVVEKDDGVNESIRLYDASLVLSHVVGVAPLSGPALLAADTTGNGEVTEQDAAQILEVAGGLQPIPFVNQLSPWQFSPPEYSYDSLTSDITNADFTAIFTGDVSGNWADVGLQSVSGLRTELESISREGVAKVKLYVTPPNLEQAVSALELGFDTTTGVSLLEVTPGELLASWREPMVSVEDTDFGNYFKVSLYDDLRGAFSTEVHALTLTLSLADGEQVLAGVSGWVNEYQSANFETLVLRMPDDNDGDFVPNAEDAFPDDVAASVDTDGDGMPDDWNEGYGATDSSTGLVVDPDDDGDGYSDIEELSEGSDPLDSGDQPEVLGMSSAILRTIIEFYRN